MDFSSVVRTLPLLAPDELIPWLLKHDLIPRSPEMDMQIEEYWQYLSSKGFPGTSDKPGSGCIPLWLWGDDCKYNKEGAKIVVVALGAVLQNSASAKDTVFPLFSFQVDTRLKKMRGYDPISSSQILALCPSKEQSLGFETLEAFLQPVLRWHHVDLWVFACVYNVSYM